MIATSRAPTTTVFTVISDLDRTLVTSDKTLMAQTVAAVAALRTRGMIISSRPPGALTTLVNGLGISAPIAGFNGGMLSTPDLKVIEQHPLRPEVARRAVELISASRRRDLGVQRAGLARSRPIWNARRFRETHSRVFALRGRRFRTGVRNDFQSRRRQ